MNGFELLEHMGKDDKLKKALIIILTAKKDSDTMKRLSLGASSFLVKPVGTEEVIAKINNLLRK